MSYHILNYTHSDPLFESLSPRMQVQRGTPAWNLKNVLDGTCEASMISLVSFLENRKSLRLLETANIHTMATTGSTLLISSGDPLKKRMDIAVTSATRTTSLYLSMILKWMKVDFRLSHLEKTDADSLLEESRYALVIGDEALKVYGTNYRILLDIGFEFSRIFEKAPVYAVTVARRDYADSLTESINENMQAYTDYTEQCAENASKRLKIEKKIMAWYYGLIRYGFERHVQAGIDFVEKMI